MDKPGLKSDKLPDDDSGRVIPVGFRIIFWLIGIGIFGLTAWIWVMALITIIRENLGVWVPGDFRRLFMGYHIIMLIVALIGWVMQIHWNRHRKMELFPVAIIIGILSMIAAAVQMAVIFYNIG